MVRNVALSSSVRLPWIAIVAGSASIWANAASVRSTSAAARCSVSRSSQRDPGMGTIEPLVCNIHTREICAGVGPPPIFG
jgi:hypothetical protein